MFTFRGKLAVGDVLGNAQQVFRFSIRATDADLLGMKKPLAFLGRVDWFFRDVQPASFTI